MSARIWPAIRRHFPELNESQQRAIGLTEGPLLIIAGPGSGKTLVLVIRALNILLQGKAQPGEMVLCTFTEKAAFELRDRIALSAKKLGYEGDLSQLQASTIHSLCNNYLMRYCHHTWLGHAYQVLDELTQALFLFDNFETIVGDMDMSTTPTPTRGYATATDDNGCSIAPGGRWLGKWSTRWTAITGLIEFFNKLTEELVDPQDLLASAHPFLQQLGQAYLAYETCLQERNCIDFSHQQKLFWELLHNPDIAAQIQAGMRYIMVDEYQDTNYVQEQLLLRLAQPQNNLCVVGDEDQSLYRFRGATVRNILEFEKHFPQCGRVELTVNYRSHRQIVAAYNKFMAACDWRNPHSEFNFRYDKTIEPNLDGHHPDYPAVFSIWGVKRQDEAVRVADLVHFLKENRVIEDYNQVALLLHSVRLKYSGPYIEALEGRGIPAFAPRARGYFDNQEIQYRVYRRTADRSLPSALGLCI